MKIVIIILAVMWVFSFIKYKRGYKEDLLLSIFYEADLIGRQENTQEGVEGLWHCATALMLAQQYSRAYDVYHEAAAMIVKNPSLDKDDLLKHIQVNIKFCRSPFPWVKQPMNHNGSWLHYFLIKGFGNRRYQYFSEESLLNFYSWKRMLNHKGLH